MLPELGDDSSTEFDGVIHEVKNKHVFNEKTIEIKTEKSGVKRPHIKHIYNFAALERKLENQQNTVPIIEADLEHTGSESEDDESLKSEKNDEWDDNLPAGFNLLKRMKTAKSSNIGSKAVLENIITDIKSRYENTTIDNQEEIPNLKSSVDCNRQYNLDQDLNETLPKAHFLIQQIKCAKAKLAENMENTDSESDTPGDITKRIDRSIEVDKQIVTENLEKYDHQATEDLLDRLSYEMHNSLQIKDSGYFSTSKYTDIESNEQTDEIVEIDEALKKRKQEQLAERRASYKKWWEKKQLEHKLKLERQRKAKRDREMEKEIKNTQETLQKKNYKSWLNRKDEENKLRNLANKIRKSIEQRQLDEQMKMRAEKIKQKKRAWEERKIREARNLKEQQKQEKEYKATLSEERELRSKISYTRWLSTVHLKPLPTPTNRGELSLEVRNIGWINPHPWRAEDDPSDISSSSDESS